MKADDFISLSKKGAQNLAEAKNFIFRLIKVDDEDYLSYPKDDETLADRVCVWIEKGKVVKAEIR